MSLILEALKKSEAERRRGQSPDLFGSALGSPPTRREIARVWPLLLLGLILLVSAWMIWSGGSRGESVAAPDPSMRASDAPAEDFVETPRAQAAAVPPPAPAPAAPIAKPGKPEVKAEAGPSRAEPAPPPAPVLPAPANRPQPEPLAPTEEALPTLSALDAASRASLPPLKLSMHVYAEDPGKRFAIVDGQRIGEGALLGGGVVEAIRRDGVVININGRRLLLPKP